MKRILCMTVLALVIAGAQALAEDVIVESNGNMTVGASDSGTNFEVTGASTETAIAGYASDPEGVGGAGVYGEYRNSVTGEYNLGVLGDPQFGVYGLSGSTNGYAGYFSGNALVTGDLTIQGSLFGGGVGDIKDVIAGPGLTGGGSVGAVTLNVDFGGTGTANTVSRTDHQHAGSDITSGTVSGVNIDAAIARDSEIMPTVLASDGEGSTLDADLLDGKEGSYFINEIMPTVLANDGAGSTLDADLLDGQSSSAIIAAAADEVRTEISACGTDITSAGSYYVSQNLTATGDCITVSANDVTIDLMGFTLTGDDGTGDYGVYINQKTNVEIKNGTVRDFDRGIYNQSTTAYQNRVFNITAISNVSGGIILKGRGNLVKGCTVAYNGGDGGIYVGSGSVVRENTAYSNSGTYGIYASSSVVSNNSTYSNSGIGINNSGGSTVNNSVYGNEGSYGIAGSGVFKNNTARSGTGGGFYIYSYSTAVNNTARDNDHWGMKADNGCNITGNTIGGNNRSDTAAEGGLLIASENHVRDNILNNNKQNNLYVNNHSANYGNVIEGNTLTRSTNGIYFNQSNNYYANNRASGHTTNYNVNTTTQVSSGNVGF